MVGGTISGNWVTASPKSAMAPTIVRKSEMTAAKIGRAMKKWLNRMVRGPSLSYWPIGLDGADDTCNGSRFAATFSMCRAR